MTNFRAWALLMGTLAALPTTGCAPPCLRHPGRHVDCRYCPAPPLPFAHYPPYVCHSCPASPYLTIPPAPSPEPAGAGDAGSDTGEVDMETKE